MSCSPLIFTYCGYAVCVQSKRLEYSVNGHWLMLVDAKDNKNPLFGSGFDVFSELFKDGNAFLRVGMCAE